MNQKGVVALAVLVLLLLVVAVSFFFVSRGIIPLPSKLTQALPGKGKEPTVSLQTQYQNPFNQYINPFSSYKNPFDSLK